MKTLLYLIFSIIVFSISSCVCEKREKDKPLELKYYGSNTGASSISVYKDLNGDTVCIYTFAGETKEISKELAGEMIQH